MSRLATLFADLRPRGEKAMGLFLTNGFPHPTQTLPLLRALDEGGADFIELGMPFSDPLAEGLPIQRASEQALAHGVTLDDAFRIVEQFRTRSETPLLLMGYINPLYRYGVSNFCRAARSSGVDGLILPDLPLEERGLLADAVAEAGLDLIYLIAPNTKDARIAAIDELASGFVYAVSMTGLTGTRLGGVDTVAAYLQRARHLVTKNPLLVGFGITSHNEAMRLSQHTDGFIVGSALIKHVEHLWGRADLSEEERLTAVQGFAEQLKKGPAASFATDGGLPTL